MDDYIKFYNLFLVSPKLKEAYDLKLEFEDVITGKSSNRHLNYDLFQKRRGSYSNSNSLHPNILYRAHNFTSFLRQLPKNQKGTLKFHNVVNLTKRAVRNDFSSSPETIVQRSWHFNFGKTKIRKPISLLSASAFCCFGHSLPVGSLNSCAYECWNIWREADSCFVHSACLA